MALKRIIEKLDDVEEALRGAYVIKDGKYHLDVAGPSDESELDDYKDRVEKMDAKIKELLDEKKSEKSRRLAAEKEAQDKLEDAAKKAGDVSALEASWKRKYEDMVAKKDADISERDGYIEKSTRHTAAIELATMLAIPGSADVLLPHIERQIGVEIRDGKPVAVVLDKDGKPSAESVDELGKRIANTAAFAPLIVASNASGGGAAGRGGSGAANGKKSASMSTVEKSAFITEYGLDAWQKKVGSEVNA